MGRILISVGYRSHSSSGPRCSTRSKLSFEILEKAPGRISTAHSFIDPVTVTMRPIGTGWDVGKICSKKSEILLHRSLRACTKPDPGMMYGKNSYLGRLP